MCTNSSDDALLDVLKAWPGDNSRAYNLLIVGFFAAVVFIKNHSQSLFARWISVVLNLA